MKHFGDAASVGEFPLSDGLIEFVAMFEHCESGVDMCHIPLFNSIKSVVLSCCFDHVVAKVAHVSDVRDVPFADVDVLVGVVVDVSPDTFAEFFVVSELRHLISKGNHVFKRADLEPSKV